MDRRDKSLTQYLVADVADNMGTTHRVHDDKQSANRDHAAVSKAVKGECEYEYERDSRENENNWEESPNCDARAQSCVTKGDEPSQRVLRAHLGNNPQSEAWHKIACVWKAVRSSYRV
jgi:hypothetical protein